MKVTMEQVVALRNHIDSFSNIPLPLKVAYKLNKIKKAIDKETEFYAEKFQEILDTYAQKDEKGEYIMSDDQTQIMIIDGKADECNDVLEELQNMEVEIETYNLTMEELGDIECTEEQVEAIIPFLE